MLIEKVVANKDKAYMEMAEEVGRRCYTMTNHSVEVQERDSPQVAAFTIG